jgi:hypothetical protein
VSGMRGVAAAVAAWMILSLVSVPPTSAGLLVTANDDSYTVSHDGVLSVPARGVLSNDAGVAPTAAKTSNPAHGTVTLNSDGSFTYRPTAGYAGSDAFTYEARVLSLGILVTDAATVRLTVTNASTPVAVNDSYVATSGVTLSVPAAGVLANDSDADGDALTAILVDGSGNGSLSFRSNGSFDFTPGGSFTGVRTFTYRASDGNRTSPVATVSITVTAAPTPRPTPTPTPKPTPTPTPAPTPTPILPTLPPILPTLPPIVPTLPPILATPTPIPTPTRPPAATPSATPTPGPTAAPSPLASATPGASASPGTAPSPGATPGDGSPRPPTSPPPPSGPVTPAGGLTTPNGGAGGAGGSAGSPIVGIDVTTDALGALGLLAWTVPGFGMAVPGILLLVVVLAQAAGGLVWLPLVRRRIGGFGFRSAEGRRSAR